MNLVNLVPVVTLVLTIAAMLYICADHPTEWTCPHGLYVLDGIRRDGTFGCWLPPKAHDIPNVRGGFTSVTDVPPILVFEAKLECGRAVPIVRPDGASVECHRP